MISIGKAKRDIFFVIKKEIRKELASVSLLGRKHNTKIKFAILGDISSQPIHCA